jgi:YHS domain-containing protein
MKTTKIVACVVLALAFAPTPLTGWAGEPKKDKPYPLQTCVVSGQKLGEMGDPYVFSYKGREIKLCCKGCQKAFDKEPEKYIKKLEEAEKTK